MSDVSIAQRVALVTGAGSGIGRAVSIALADAGFAVVLAGRRPQALAETGRMIAATGGQTLERPTDITRADEVHGLFEAIAQRYGRLDLLFNNAGTNAPPGPIEDLALHDWQGVVDVNLTGAFLCAQAAFRMMKCQVPRGGRIINNGSISAHAPRPNSVAYTATKHAIQGLTKCLSLDGRPYDIACGQIDIGNAATDMASAMMSGAKQANGDVAVEPVIDVRLVGDAVVHMANLPLGANVQFMTLMATKMPFIGRG